MVVIYHSIVDIANLMLYDLHGGWDDVTDLHSAIYPQNQSYPYYSQVKHSMVAKQLFLVILYKDVPLHTVTVQFA